MKVSVVIATYNGAEFLKEQMDSILSQTLPPDEIIIADDCSDDGTWEIIQKYCHAKPDLIHAYKNGQRLGPHQNFKEAFKHATGDIIAPSDQDDIWLPNKLERSCAVLLESGKDLCFMQEKVLHEDGSLKDDYREITPLYETIYQTYLWGHTCVFRRGILEAFEVCPYYAWDSTLGLWCQCLDSVVSIDEVGSIWRRHPGVSTTFFSDHSGLVFEDISPLKKALRALSLLARGKRSEPIGVVMRQEHLLVEACYRKTGSKLLRLYSRLLELISHQTPMAMLRGGCYSVRINIDALNGLSFVDKVKKLAWAFRKPLVWWYDLKDQKRIGNTEPGYLNR